VLGLLVIELDDMLRRKGIIAVPPLLLPHSLVPQADGLAQWFTNGSLAPRQLPAQHHLAGLVNPVNLKNALGQIQPDRRNLCQGWSPLLELRQPNLAHRCRSGAIHPIKPGHDE
jgi:hypothetical protein